MNVEEMAKVMMDWRPNVDDFDAFGNDIIASVTKHFPHATPDEIRCALEIAFSKRGLLVDRVADTLLQIKCEVDRMVDGKRITTRISAELVNKLAKKIHQAFTQGGEEAADATLHAIEKKYGPKVACAALKASSEYGEVEEVEQHTTGTTRH
jgi:hypothetical protein